MHAADTTWSTAPNTPTSKQKNTPDSPPKEKTNSNSSDSLGSYEKAILNSEALWEWNTGGNEAREAPTEEVKLDQLEQAIIHQLPKHISSVPATSKMNTGSEVKSQPSTANHAVSHLHRDQLAPGVNLVMADAKNAKVGFFPTTAPIDTTNPSELPGSCDSVITKPPASQGSKVGRLRAGSIEEESKRRENYAPEITKSPDYEREGLAEPGACLGFASYLGSSVPEEKPANDSGKGSSLALRKLSIASSKASAVSVS